MLDKSHDDANSCRMRWHETAAWPDIMNGINYFLFFAVAIEILWIVTSAMRKKEEEADQQQRRPRPDAFERPRPRTVPTNVDRFLEEINRRRQEAAQRQGMTLQERIDDAVTRRRQETGASFPAPQQKPRPLSPLPEVPTRRVQAPSPPSLVVNKPPPVVPVVRDMRRISEPVLVVEPVEMAPAKPAAAAAAKASASAQDAMFATPEIRRAVSPLRDKLIPLLRSRQALPLAVVLNEVFGQPVSQRPRRSYRNAARGQEHPPANSSPPAKV
jgi:hypothetical protein